MKRKSWETPLILVMAIFLIGIVVQIGINIGQEKKSKTDLEEKRLELLGKNSWLKLSKETIIKGNSTAFEYGILKHSGGTIEEYVMVRIFPPKEKVGPYQFYDINKAQYYHIFGRGDRIFQVGWFSKEIGIEVVIYLPEMKCNEDLSKEVVEKIANNGTGHYLEVRKDFNVDTYEGLKKIIEEEKKRLAEEASKIIK